MAQDTAKSGDALRRVFERPPISARPKLRWWWPGGAVEPQVLRECLRGFHANGFGGVEIQPFRVGLPNALPSELAARVHDYATASFREKVAAVTAEAERLGMSADFTFGSCWPMGGGWDVTPERAASEVSLAWRTVKGPCRVAGELPDVQRPERSATYFAQHGRLTPEQALPEEWLARMRACEQTIAVLALKGTAPTPMPFAGFVPMTMPDRWGDVTAPGWIDARETIDLSGFVGAAGEIDWQAPEGEWQIVVCRRFVLDQTIGEAAGVGPQLVIDHLSRDAFEVHAARLNGEGANALEHLGLSAVFEDSLEIPADIHWTGDFAAEFERRRGYVLSPYLPLVLHPGWRNCFQARVGPPLFDDPNVGKRIRADYRRTVSELMIERHYGAFAQWARDHGVRCRIQAHGSPTDLIETYGLCDMPETEDLAGNGAAHFVRMARSAAHIYGKGPVSAEAFVWLLEGLAVTPEKLRRRADQLFVSGVQQIIGHGASYPLHLNGERWYPWRNVEFSSMLDDGNPLWPYLRPLADYIARTQAVLNTGDAVVRCAVLAPLDLFAHESASCRPAEPLWHAALQTAGYDWDWLNADGLLKCTQVRSGLRTPGGHQYDVLVVPAMKALRRDVARAISEAARGGLKVIFLECAPCACEEFFDHEAGDREVVQLMEALLERGPGIVRAPDLGRAVMQTGVEPNVVIDGGREDLRFLERRVDGRAVYFIRNQANGDRVATLRLPAGVESLSRWDAWTGQIETLPRTDGLSVPVRLNSFESAILVASHDPPGSLPPAARTAGAVMQPSLREMRLAGVGRRGRPIEATLLNCELTDISQRDGFEDFAGQSHYVFDFELPADRAANTWLMDLGRVCDVASVSVNEGARRFMCEAPFVVDLTPALRPGRNEIVVTVANTPENALRDPNNPGGIPVPGRRLDKLPSGLLGPVTLQAFAAAPSCRWRIAASEQTRGE